KLTNSPHSPCLPSAPPFCIVNRKPCQCSWQSPHHAWRLPLRIRRIRQPDRRTAWQGPETGHPLQLRLRTPADQRHQTGRKHLALRVRRLRPPYCQNQCSRLEPEFLWQGDRLIAEETGDRYRTYIYEADSFKPLALVDGYGPEQARIYYYHLDHL